MIRPALTVVAAVVALTVSACGGSDSSTPGAAGTGSSHTSGGSSSTPGSPSTSAAVVDGITLTPQGSRLKVGDSARISWQPNGRTTGVAKVSVTKLAKVPISTFSDWRLTGPVLRSTPYFVHATVRNLGRSNLSHAAVPLYLQDAHNTLIRTSTFQARFAPCPSRPLPARFTHGKRASVCLVYFVPRHGKLTAISFRPTEQFQAITWTGPVAQPKKKH